MADRSTLASARQGADAQSASAADAARLFDEDDGGSEPTRVLATTSMRSGAEQEPRPCLAESDGDWPLAIEWGRRRGDTSCLDPDGGRELSGLIEPEGRLEEAIHHALRAHERAPNVAAPALQAGRLLSAAGRYEEAVACLTAAADLSPDDAEVFRLLCAAAQKTGRPGIAAQAALRLSALDRSNHDVAIEAAHLLHGEHRRNDAIEVLRQAMRFGEPNGRLHRVLSGFLSEGGDVASALEEAVETIRLEPEVGDHHFHLAGLLLRLGLFDRAAQAVQRCLKIGPDNLDARRLGVSIYLETGDVDRALVACADLVRLAPDQDEYLRCMQHVLALKLDAAETSLCETKGDKIRLDRLPQPRPGFAKRSLGRLRVVAALLHREMRTRFGESRLGYLWALLEPVMHMGLLALIFKLTMSGKPPLGHSLFFFYFTGLVPYQLFTHTVSQTGHAILQNKPLLQLAPVTNIDVVVARGILEFFTELAVALILICAFLAVGVDALPKDPAAALAALLSVWLVALGFGLFNAVVNVFTTAWDRVMQIGLRALYVASGIFYIPGAMPEWVRHILVWNPVLQCVDWLRTAFFTDYHPVWLNRSYPLLVALLGILLGLGVERCLRRKLTIPV